ncbi:MAG: serine/threonine-protein kinase [Polyangiales bacterium]
MSQGYYNPNAAPDGAPPSHLGGYRLIDLLGRGGMGEVWRAEQEGPGNFRRRAAIKRILPRFQNDPALRARFVAEARTNARLEHPNIVQVLSFGDQPEPFLALEFVEGTTVARVLKACAETQQRIPPAAVLFLVAEAAKGLDYAHRKRDENGQPLGIVHRDVSPQNLLLSFDGVVKVSDFGIARAADNNFRTGAGAQVGKLAYTAPEQVMGAAVDHRADVFSLAVVLWETLLVRPLVPRNDPNLAMQVLCNGQFEIPSAVDPRLPNVLDQIVMTALAVDPAQRTPSAGDLAAQLQTLVHAISPGFDNAELVRVLATLLPSFPWHHPGGAARPASMQFSMGGPAPAPGPGGPGGMPYGDGDGETVARGAGMGGAGVMGGAPGMGGGPRPATMPPATAGAAMGGMGAIPPSPGGGPVGGLGGLPPSPGGGAAMLGGLPPASGGGAMPLGGELPPLRDGSREKPLELPSIDPPKPKPVDRNKLTQYATIGIVVTMVLAAGVALVWLTSGHRDPVAVPNDNFAVNVTFEDTTSQVMSAPAAGGAAPVGRAAPADYANRALEALNRVTPQVQNCIRRVRCTATNIRSTVDFDNGSGRVTDVTLAPEGGEAPAELLACMRGVIHTASFTPDPGIINITRVVRVWPIRRVGGGGGGGPGGTGTVAPRFPFGTPR